MKRHDTWEKLYKVMSNKRTKQNEASNKNRKLGSAPHEIVVQKLSSEPDSKQTYRPIQPREFVSFEFDEITLSNLKSACAAHFGLPVSTCDVLVSNKGPSCTVAKLALEHSSCYVWKTKPMGENYAQPHPIDAWKRGG